MIPVLEPEVRTSVARVMIRAAAVLIALPGFAACSKNIDFTEEVQLADGQVITVTRHVAAESLGEIGGPGG